MNPSSAMSLEFGQSFTDASDGGCFDILLPQFQARQTLTLQKSPPPACHHISMSSCDQSMTGDVEGGCFDIDVIHSPRLSTILSPRLSTIPDYEIDTNYSIMTINTPTTARTSFSMSVGSGYDTPFDVFTPPETPAPHSDWDLKEATESGSESESESESESVLSFEELSCSSSSSSSVPMADLLCQMQSCEEEISLAEHGYRSIGNISDTLQGTLIKAEIIRSTKENAHIGDVGSMVAIKRAEKKLVAEKIVVEKADDEQKEDISIVVDENIVKEARVLKYLTFQNKCPYKDKIATFVEFFEDDTYYYLVTEYVEGITLREFMEQAVQYIGDGSLSRKKYICSVKSILWQLVSTLRWMHEAHRCVHLDLTMSSIMLTPENHMQIFEQAVKGKMAINKSLIVKLVDFGVSEIYPPGTINFNCSKMCLTLDQFQCRCPNQQMERSYNAKAHDMWCVGHLFFELMTASKLYTVQELFYADKSNGGLKALMTNQLRPYLKRVGLMQCFTAKQFALVEGLLTMDEEHRWTAAQVTESGWYAGQYRNKYLKSLKSKIKSDASKAAADIQDFPFYCDNE